MNTTLRLTLSGMLLATTALVAPPVALAQSAGQAGPETVAPYDYDSQQDPGASSVEEIVILGEFIPQPMRETSEVSSFLSAEDLTRQGDDDAAAALTRVTGLSVVEGRFVYVRGLGERYSSARLNGSPLPSPEPLQRVVPLDLFPSSVLRSIAVQKTYSADRPGEFGGGVIDLRTLSTPVEPFLTIGASIGAHSETTLQEGLIHFGSRTDFTGFDDGTRDMPRELREALATGNRVVEGPNFTAEDIQRIGRSMVNAPLNLLQTTEYVPVNFGIDLSGGRSFDLAQGTLGVIGVLGYSNDWRTREGVQGEGFLDMGQIVARRDYDFASTENNVGWDGLLGVSLESGEHLVQWTNLLVRRTTKETRTRSGEDFDAPGTGLVRDDFTAWYERQLFNTQLAGEHRWGDWGLDWRAAYATTSRNAPYEKYIRYSIDPNGVPFHQGQSNSTTFSELDDEILSGGVDVNYTLPLSDLREMVIAAGAETLDNTRDSQTRIFSFQGSGLSDAFQRQRVDFLFSDVNQAPGGLQLRETTGGAGAAAYEAGLRVHAGYVHVDAEAMPRLRVAAGVRYEDAEQTVTPIDLFGGTSPFQPTRLENQYWLPAATLTWNFAEDLQLRLGASRTIGRPQFRELAPQQYLDPDSDRLFIGNPYLTDSELTNLDARVEWYYARDQYLTAGVFLKDIDRPVESVINDTGSVVQQTYVNAPRAVLYGLELDGRRHFDSPFAGDFWDAKRWMIQANYTYTASELRVESGDTVYPLSGGGVGQPATNYFRDGDRLQGQSEHMANLQFGYEDDIARSRATLLVTWVSERSSARGRPGEPDLIQEPGAIVDFVYRREFGVGDRDFRLGFEARNLLGEEFHEYQELGNRVDINRYELGRSVSLSLSTDF